MSKPKVNLYDESSIQTLDWKEHIRHRPGMYIGKLGDGTSPDDGIYVLIKEVLDNSVDEFMMGYGKRIDISIEEHTVSIRDYGRGVPLNKLIDVSSKMNTGAKYDSKVFKKSVGLNGVGIKAVNALSSSFSIFSVREEKKRTIEYVRGVVQTDKTEKTNEPNGTGVSFVADNEIFPKHRYMIEFVTEQIRNYSFLNTGLTLVLNGEKYVSKGGLLDLLKANMDKESLYEIIHLRGEDIELAFTHGTQYGEDYHSFVNGQNTTQGGTHLMAFREAIVRTLRDFYKKEYDPTDIRASIVAAISIKVEEPVFESQTKTKLGSKGMSPNGVSVRNYIMDFVKKELDNFLHRNAETAERLLRRIQDAERERKAMAGVKKIAKERAKKAALHNRKLRDCKIHFNSSHEQKDESSLFITEGDSASGSITKARNVYTQAVFSLKGKPLNSYGLAKKIVYENEEFNLLQAALNIEEDLDNLRYNKIVIATDADVDGMHIRLLLLTFFLQFFPEIVRKGHLFILETPLFRVRDKQHTHYCYSNEEKMESIAQLRGKPEITRFKGLGEISPDEFKHFIGKDMRLEPVVMKKHEPISDLLSFYMGKNTPDRQHFIIDNLRSELDRVHEEQEIPV